MGSVYLGLLALLALVALLSSVYTTLVGAALTRISRSQASHAHAQGAKYILRVVEQRPAAASAVNLIYGIQVAVFAIAATLAIDTLTESWWITLVICAGGTFVLFPLLRILVPASIGHKHPVAIIAAAGGFLLFVTWFTAKFVREREPADEEEREAYEESARTAMVERVAESKAVDDDERSLLESVFKLSSTRVREVMVPRTDMITIDSQESLDKAVSLFVRSGFSRVPVAGESVDDLLGVLYLKDAISKLHGKTLEPASITQIMRSPVFVPETMMADDLLHQMQSDSNHIALVVDEYGGIAGLVTIEDLLEELVGEMNDEHDRALPELQELGDGTYRLPARMPISEVGELFDLELEDDDVDTIGGLLTKALGRVPIWGSKVEVQGLALVADGFEGRRKRLAWVRANTVEEENE
ncbi:CBS domain containing-hemolysin-like protein [Arcanobacterium wilhelmae]|uniref:CBS domain containing-hemolysin-like protein n=1 Tax=Arcanobacterium wilhelmae TaxID=1803177 RepID=A0ABT9NDD4_9ACTO|nr:hemolysin family protein [Arcanobacterium wilhelmae]MDP9801731.1 CBS domain containing-hemolysin-like protein [Arcanobacterium wilhelmae]WFN91048.1 hemolysin family protein [Arcanobacterium wilhelmae]